MNPKKLITSLLHITSGLIPSSILRRWVHRNLISIFYHAISDHPMDHVRHLYPVVPVEGFINALRTMQDNFNIVTYEQIQECYNQKKPFPPKALHFSFDDGFSECYNVVRPILIKMGIPCTFFLTIDWLDNHVLYFRHELSIFVARFKTLDPPSRQEVIWRVNQRFGLSSPNDTAFIDWLTGFREPDDKVLEEMRSLFNFDPDQFLSSNQPYLSRSQVKEMHQDGFTIGAHGLSHRKLGFIPREEVGVEIVGACDSIQAITQQQVVPFSFPQSAGNIDRDQLADIRLRHPQVGLLFDTKDLRLDAPFMINRIWAERPLTADRILHPLPEVLAHAYREAWVEDLLTRARQLS